MRDPFPSQRIGDLPRLMEIEDVRVSAIEAERCVIVHFFYAEPIDYILSALASMRAPYDLIVTLVADSPAEAARNTVCRALLATSANRIRLVRMPNLGDDTIPFLTAVLGGLLDSYRSVCKLHGKVTQRNRELGQKWLRTMVEDLLVTDGDGSPDRFLSSEVPLVGSTRLLVTHPHLWSDNLSASASILAKLGVNMPAGQAPFFFAGTSFWLDRWLVEQLDPLRDYQLDEGDLSYGADGKFGHAFERCLALFVLLAGRAVGDTNGRCYTVGAYPLGLVPEFLAKAFSVPPYEPPVSTGRSGQNNFAAPKVSRTRLSLARGLECLAFALRHGGTVRELRIFDAMDYTSVARGLLPSMFPLLHYLCVGWRRQIAPIKTADADLLAQWYPPHDVQGRSPLETYVEFGRYYGLEFMKRGADLRATTSVVWSSAPSSEIAVIVHAFHMKEYEALLKALAPSAFQFDLIITTPHDSDLIRIRAQQYGLQVTLVHRVPNHGRDILPFVLLLNAGLAERYSFLIKLHTKRSFHRPDGRKWFEHCMQALVRRDGLSAARDRFATEPLLGLLVPPHNLASLERLEPNWSKIRALSAALGYRIAREDVVFPAGSMFWARSAALQKIVQLNLSPDDFEVEAGQLDGTMAHALERFFGISCVKEGYAIDEIRA